MPEIGLPSTIPGYPVVFIPLPDPTVPETLKPAYLSTLQQWGVIQPNIVAYYSRQLVNGVIPNDFRGTLAANHGKYWRDTTAMIWGALKAYRYLDIKGSLDTTDPATFSDESFRYAYSPSAVQLYRTGYPDLKMIPKFRQVAYQSWEAAGINMEPDIQQSVDYPYPLGGFMDNSQGEILEGSRLPTNIAYRYSPSNARIVEAFVIADYVVSMPKPTPVSKPNISIITKDQAMSQITEIVKSGIPDQSKLNLIKRVLDLLVG